MRKHTPGPWKRGGETSDGWYIYAGKTAIAQTIASVDVDEERENARLIAASPKLLAACKALIAEHVIFCFDGEWKCPFCQRTELSPIDFQHNPTCPVIQARTAIAEATRKE
jgi:hypothetical protein